MKGASSEYPFSKCLACGGPVIPELQIEEDRKKFMYENAASNNSPFPSTHMPPKSTQPFYGFSCRVCGIFYIFPPPLNKERWDMAEKIFLGSLPKPDVENSKPTEEEKEKPEIEETQTPQHTSHLSEKHRRQRHKPQLPKK